MKINELIHEVVSIGGSSSSIQFENRFYRAYSGKISMKSQRMKIVLQLLQVGRNVAQILYCIVFPFVTLKNKILLVLQMSYKLLQSVTSGVTVTVTK